MATPFQRFTLQNGLRLIVHEDHNTPLAAINLVYNVGSRDELPTQTGIAHLFEHYMFCGSKHIPNFDLPLQKIGAINNAYTSQDHTHYYAILPAQNLETVLWLESDRMLALAFKEEELETQKRVVIEEFKETTLNRPFGDLWSVFNDFVFDQYPYKWTPIGREIAHIESVTRDTMYQFHQRFYCPNNAVLAIGGNVQTEEVVALVEKWFGDIPKGNCSKQLPEEPQQTTAKTEHLRRDVPFGLLLKGWKMPHRLHPDFCTYDLLSDILGTGKSSYLHQKFVEEKHLFTDISASITGCAGPGIFTIVGRPADGVSLEKANEELNDYLYGGTLYDDQLAHNLQKVKNRIETTLLTNDIKVDSRTYALAISENISCIEDIEKEERIYPSITESQITTLTTQMLQPQKECTLFYESLHA